MTLEGKEKFNIYGPTKAEIKPTPFQLSQTLSDSYTDEEGKKDTNLGKRGRLPKIYLPRDRKSVV